jgi:hypothetical protein
MIGRADLSQVGRGSVGAFRAGDAKAGDITLRVIEVVVADPGEREVGEHLVTVRQIVEGDGVARSGNGVLAAQDHALRAAGRA